MPIVSTGQLTVTDVSETPVISLTNTSHQVATDAYGLNGNYFGCNTTVKIYLGNQEVSASWTITATPSSGVTGTLSDRTYSVTAVTEDVGYVDFTATQFGWESLTTRFSITKSRRGEAGQALVILPSTLGFTFVDGVPSPQTQSIAFSAYKNGVVGDVEWQVSEGASLFTDTSAQGSMTGFLFGTPGTVVGDIAYMDVADMYDKNEVVVSATCDGVTASHVVMRLDAYTAEAGATRNEISQGVLASRPAGTAGEFYYATDTREVFQYIDGGWKNTANNTYIDASGKIQGAGASSGTVVDNDKIDIGGINFIKNSTSASFATALSGSPTLTTESITLPDGSSGAAIKVVFGAAGSIRIPNCLRGNDTYSFSTYHRVASGTASFSTDIADRNAATIASTTSWAWHKQEGAVVTNYTAAVYNFLDIATSAATTLYLWHPQMEYGNKATDWMPAIEDLNASIDAAGTTATWSSVSGTGKPADNANNTYVDSSGNIQGVSSGSGLSVSNNTDSVIRAPGGGIYTTKTVTLTGRLKITLPQSWTSTMMRFTVEIYEYSTGYMCTLEVGGYNYNHATSPGWYNVSARVIGGSNVEYPVYFGHDITKCCIWVGNATNETWSYPQVRIRDFFAGYSNYEQAKWERGWAITFDQTNITSGGGTNQYSALVLDTLPGADWAKISGSSKPADGATRNVFQGDWVNGTTYAVGDVVVKDGYSWTCKVSTSSVAPPTYPTTSNANWGLSGEKGDSALAVIMPNDAHTLPASSAGMVSSYTGSGTTIEVMDGSTKLSASSTATTSAFRITSTSVSPASSITVGAITYSGTTATVAAHSAMGNSNDTVQITYNITAYRANGTAVNLTKVQTLTKSKEGAAGQTATSYWLMSSAAAVQKSIAGAYTPTSVTYSIQSATGTSAPAAYAGRFIIATSTDGSTYTDQYTSLANESSKAYTVPASIKTIRVRAYLAGGTATLLDELITTVVSDGATGSSGASAVVAILSNEAHVFPAASDGAVSSYAGSGTKIRVYEGATELAYDGVGTSNSTWKIASSATNITVGTVTDSGSYASVGVHSGVAAGTDTSSITYTLTGKTTAGTAFSITKDQTFTKAKAGSNGSKGDTGAQGPSVIVTTSRAASFTSTDGILDASQTDIVFTATVSGVTSPTYSWTFSGLQTNPTTASTTSTQTITAAQFGNSKSATVTCTVSSTYKDVVTIVRLEKSTAAAGATVGAPAGTYVGGTLAQTVESNASTALSTANAANDAVGNKLDKASSEILSVAITGTTRVAGLKAGDLVWNASGNRTSGKGVAITPSGILGHNGTKSTFAINATTGDATFSGTLNVASGTSGERMEITNSVIKVYDAAGVLRVKLGNLAL